MLITDQGSSLLGPMTSRVYRLLGGGLCAPRFLYDFVKNTVRLSPLKYVRMRATSDKSLWNCQLTSKETRRQDISLEAPQQGIDVIIHFRAGNDGISALCFRSFGPLSTYLNCPLSRYSSGTTHEPHFIPAFIQIPIWTYSQQHPAPVQRMLMLLSIRTSYLVGQLRPMIPNCQHFLELFSVSCTRHHALNLHNGPSLSGSFTIKSQVGSPQTYEHSLLQCFVVGFLCSRPWGV